MASVRDLMGVGIPAEQAVLLANGYISVVTNGAVGNGTHDDTGPIQTTINQVVAAGYGVVYFPPGIFKITSKLTIPITARNVCLLGYGASLRGYCNSVMLQISDITTSNDRAENISILGLGFTGDGATSSTYPLQSGIEIDAILNCVLRDVKVESVPVTGIIGQKSSQTGSRYWNLVKFDHVAVRFIGGQGANICVGLSGDDLTCICCLFNNLGENTSALTSDAGVAITCATLNMIGCEISAVQNYVRGLVARKAAGLMTACHFEENCGNQANSVDLLLDTDCWGMSVIGCSFTSTSTAGAKTAIYCTSPSCRIDGIQWAGSVTHTYDYVVDLSAATNVQLGSVVFTGSPQVGPNTAVISTGSGTSYLGMFGGVTDTVQGTAALNSTLGTTIVTNGTFAGNLNSWTSTGWTYGSNSAVHTNGNTNALSQNVTITAGLNYLISITYSGTMTNGAPVVTLNGTTITTFNTVETVTAATSYGFYQAGGSGSVVFAITPVTNFVGAVSAISIKAVTANAAYYQIVKDTPSTTLYDVKGGFALHNLAIGKDCFFLNNSGTYNLGIGERALAYNINGAENTAIGQLALQANGTGYDNVAVGFNALTTNISGFENVAIGSQALTANTSGAYNTALGFRALYANTGGYSNTSIGVNSLFNNTTGTYNVAVGSNCLLAQTTATGNCAIGIDCLHNNTGNYNNGVGLNCLIANTSGTLNNGFGQQALESCTDGHDNSAFGDSALANSVSAYGNTAVGSQAGIKVTSGLIGVYIGKDSGGTGGTNITGNNNICLGYATMPPDPTANNQMNLGNTIYADLSGKRVFVGATTGNANALLDLQSTTMPFMPPRMTTTQRDAVASPTAGMMIYNSSTNKLNVYTTGWEAVVSA